MPRSYPNQQAITNFRLAYIDEAYTAHHYRIGAVIIAPENVNAGTKALRSIVKSASENFGVDPETELHPYDVFHGVKGWECLHRMLRARIGSLTSGVSGGRAPGRASSWPP
jgi:hypothetical protein